MIFHSKALLLFPMILVDVTVDVKTAIHLEAERMNLRNTWVHLVGLRGLEPPTHGLGNRRSIH